MDIKHINNNSDELVLFLLGWGMDPNPITHISSYRDILYVYDYSDLSLNFDFSQYKGVHVLAFSCGVYMAGYLKNILPKALSSVAINGTLRLFDEQYGISQQMENELRNISVQNYIEFRKNYLVETEEELERFNATPSLRTLESSLAELDMLRKIYSEDVHFDFDRVFSSVSDKLIPFDSQVKAWKPHNHIVTPIKGAHFPFYNNKRLEEFLPTICF